MIGYCGLYCGACGIYQGRVRNAVENLRKVVNAYGFGRMAAELANWEPAFQHYAEFEEVLDGLVKLFGNCPGCVAGGGNPDCVIRECCRHKAYITCAECKEIDTCEEIERMRTLERLREIRAIGVDCWAKEMQKKVVAGYCYLDDEAK